MQVIFSNIRLHKKIHKYFFCKISLKDIYNFICIAPSKPLTIVGGEDAADGEFPWQVQLRSSASERSLFCGGWVLNENWVGTAAHCCTGSLPRGIHVVAGGILRVEDDEGEEQFSDVTEIVIHEDYSSRNHENDICLLHVSKS